MNLLLLLLILCTLIQAYYFLFIFRGLSAYPAEYESSGASLPPRLPVSVVIAAKNEASNLIQFLPIICEQDYPEYEVIVVDDHSTDQSHSVLSSLQERYPKLNILRLREQKSRGKKAALRFGIEAAKYELLILTDADCKPASKMWLSKMSQSFTPETDIVLGFGPYKSSPTFLNTFIQFETFMTAVQYFSWSLAGHPYMGVGRNMAYRKTLFDRSDRFSKNEDLLSGDDDLFVQAMANGKNTSIQVSKNSFCESEAPKTIGEWIRQKTRHFSTSKRYSFATKFRLAFFSLSFVIFYIVSFLILILAITLGSWNLLFIVVFTFLVRWCFTYFSLQRSKELLSFSGSLLFIPVYDFLYFLYHIFFAPAVFLNKTIRWS